MIHRAFLFLLSEFAEAAINSIYLFLFLLLLAVFIRDGVFVCVSCIACVVLMLLSVFHKQFIVSLDAFLFSFCDSFCVRCFRDRCFVVELRYAKLSILL